MQLSVAHVQTRYSRHRRKQNFAIKLRILTFLLRCGPAFSQLVFQVVQAPRSRRQTGPVTIKALDSGKHRTLAQKVPSFDRKTYSGSRTCIVCLTDPLFFLLICDKDAPIFLHLLRPIYRPMAMSVGIHVPSKRRR